MARTAYPSFLSGDAWTASQANTYWRDNDLQYFPYTTTGDLQYAASSSTTSRLAIGTKYQSLITNSGATAPQWFSMMPCCKIYKSGSQTMGSGGPVTVTFDSEFTDILGWHSGSDSAITPTVAGFYIAVGQLYIADISGSGNYYYQASIYYNAVTEYGMQREFADQTALSKVINVTSSLIQCNGTTDTISMVCEQNTGDTLSISASTSLTVFLVRPT